MGGEEQGPAGGVTRRRLLVGAGAVGAAAALGVATVGTPFGGGRRSLVFWHLFTGGDGERLTTMLAADAKANPQTDVRQLILPWGNPYYTKLSLAVVGGSPPDVAVMHATRVSTFAPAGLLEEITPEMQRRHDLEPTRFLERPWKSGASDGRQYAIPLDTHPFVLYYNTEMARKAGVVDRDGALRGDLDGPDGLLELFAAVAKATGKDGVVWETRGVTPWRLFLTLYAQQGGRPIITGGGTGLAIDDAMALRALEWMAKPKQGGFGGADVDYQASVANFGNGSAAFALNGEWEVTTFQSQKLPFDMRTIPAVFDGPQTQADSHTFVIPRNPDRPPERTEAALAFISRMVGRGLEWAGGGHVPASREVFESGEYRKLKPQSNYAAAAENVVFDPPAWYSGSGSDLEVTAGAAFKGVVTGTKAPEQGLADFRGYLERLSSTPTPV